MRYRLMATYRGAPFEAGIGPGDGDVVLFAACPPPEELGFGPATGHWRKQLRLEEVQAVWESRPVGSYRGERCLILDDLGDRLHVGYLGHDSGQAEQLGYHQVDRGVYELMVARDDVTEIVEERTDYLQRSDLTGPMAAIRPEPYAQPPGGGQQSQLQGGPPPRQQLRATYSPAPDQDTGVALPEAAEAPLPLEAAAMQAAVAFRQRRRPPSGPGPRRRAAGGQPGIQHVFAELASRAAIASTAYAIGAEVDGRVCLLPTRSGFEVFSAAAGARHEVREFGDEESAYFYLFGLLAAEAVRTGRLAPSPGQPLDPAAAARY